MGKFHLYLYVSDSYDIPSKLDHCCKLCSTWTFNVAVASHSAITFELKHACARFMVLTLVLLKI